MSQAVVISNSVRQDLKITNILDNFKSVKTDDNIFFYGRNIMIVDILVVNNNFFIDGINFGKIDVANLNENDNLIYQFNPLTVQDTR